MLIIPKHQVVFLYNRFNFSIRQHVLYWLSFVPAGLQMCLNTRNRSICANKL